MRILFAVHAYKPAYRVGGPIISVSSLAERLIARGHQVIVFTTNSNLDQDLDVPVDRPIDVDGVEVWYFRRHGFFRRWLPFVPYLAKTSGFVYAPEMASKLDTVVRDVDLVHTHLPFIYPTLAAARAAFRHRKPLFYHQRGVFDPARLRFRSYKKTLYINAIERPILRKANTLIALTEAEVSSYQALGIGTPIRIVPNGVDVRGYRKESERDFPGIARHSKVILFMGRVHPLKGADVLLEAFIRIHASFPDALLVMAGPDEFGMQSAFQETVREQGLMDRVIFPGMVSGQDKLNLLARADLFCLPSMGEGFSIAVLEALASATPVLISPGCHFPGVESAGIGVIAEPKPQMMATALSDLLSNPERLKAMGATGREFVRAYYSWDAITDQMIEVYQEGLERNKSTARSRT